MSDKIDKVFDLLEKVYTELQDTKNEVRKLGTIIENDIKPDIKAVYQLQTDVVVKLDNHDLRLKVIEESVGNLSA
jgi:hypothetical protein